MLLVWIFFICLFSLISLHWQELTLSHLIFLIFFLIPILVFLLLILLIVLRVFSPLPLLVFLFFTSQLLPHSSIHSLIHSLPPCSVHKPLHSYTYLSPSLSPFWPWLYISLVHISFLFKTWIYRGCAKCFISLTCGVFIFLSFTLSLSPSDVNCVWKSWLINLSNLLF